MTNINSSRVVNIPRAGLCGEGCVLTLTPARSGQRHSSGQRGGAGRIQFWFGVRGILEKDSRSRSRTPGTRETKRPPAPILSCRDRERFFERKRR
jgi:hypothetical protein